MLPQSFSFQFQEHVRGRIEQDDIPIGDYFLFWGVYVIALMQRVDKQNYLEVGHGKLPIKSYSNNYLWSLDQEIVLLMLL